MLILHNCHHLHTIPTYNYNLSPHAQLVARLGQHFGYFPYSDKKNLKEKFCLLPYLVVFQIHTLRNLLTN